MNTPDANKQNAKPFLDALNKKPVSRIPMWFMRQAGRYLPEYRELRAGKNGFLDMAYDPVAACEVTMQPIRRFHMDAAILFSDILVVPHALGQHLEFVPGVGPKLDALDCPGDLNRLSRDNFHTVLGPVYETVKNVRTALSEEGFDDVALIGFAGSPWTVATYMIEGGSSRDFLKTKEMAYRDPDGFSAIIDLLVEMTAEYCIAQVDAGAQALQLFDSWVSALDADQFGRWVTRPTSDIVSRIRKVYPDIPIIGFPKGAGINYLSYVDQTGITAAGMDSSLPVDWAAENLQTRLPVQGNLDPFCLLAGGQALDDAIDRILQNLSGGPFVFNLGHGINKDTPIAHVEQAIARVRGFKP
ncbi:MAG: uroporphyrinogen decarboxylase [Micavibrio sp.]|nr:uroporphyrinogen decarboxylase [Micavibrio sp.]